MVSGLMTTFMFTFSKYIIYISKNIYIFFRNEEIMKAIIILILSFLLFSYSISAEEKEGALTAPDKNVEIKVLKEQINIQEKALSNLASRSGHSNEWFIVGAAAGGTLLGAALGALLSFWLTNKSARNNLRNNIVADCLKFVFKMRDIINNFYIDKDTYFKLKKTDIKEAEKLYSKIFREYDDAMKEGFFTELNFYSYQVKRLNDQELLKEFVSVVDAQGQLLDKLFQDSPLGDIKAELPQCRKLIEEFTTYCIDISKV
jgi:hypothetical protein